MKKLVSFFLVFSMLAPSIAFAESTVVIPSIATPEGEADVGNAISPMKKGQRAVFTGVLFSPGAAATVITELSTVDEKIKIEVDKVSRTCVSKCEYEKSELKIQFEADKKILLANAQEKDARIVILSSEIKKLESQQINPYLWTGLGFVGGTAVALLTIFALGQIAK